MDSQFGSKITNLCVTKLGNSPAITRIPRLDIDESTSQLDSSRFNQRLLKFHPDTLEEWNNLPTIDKTWFKKKLEQRLENPQITGSRLSGGHNLYKIKRKRPPLRLTYHADENKLIVTALSVGKRDGDVYKEMLKRYSNKNA